MYGAGLAFWLVEAKPASKQQAKLAGLLPTVQENRKSAGASFRGLNTWNKV